MNDFLKKMFIDQAKPALDRHSGSGGNISVDDDVEIIDVTELPEPTIRKVSISNEPVPSTTYEVDADGNWNVVGESVGCEVVYLNTSLSVDEVVAEIKKVTQDLDAVYGDFAVYEYYIKFYDEYGYNIETLYFYNYWNENEDGSASYSDEWCISSSAYGDIFNSAYGGWYSEFDGILDMAVIAEKYGYELVGSVYTDSYVEWNEYREWDQNPYVNPGVINKNSEITKLISPCAVALLKNTDINANTIYRLPSGYMYRYYESDKDSEWVQFSHTAYTLEDYFKDYDNIRFMFSNQTIDKSIPVFDLSNLTNIDYMFADSTISTPISLFDTSKIISMEHVFDGCTFYGDDDNYEASQLEKIPLFDTSNVKSMSFMFTSSNVVTVPLFNTSNVTNMSNMFKGCRALISVPAFDTSKVTNMPYMFSGCDVLTSVPAFDTSNVKNMYYMFKNCSALTSVPAFDTSNVKDMSNMFQDCSALTSVPAFDTSKVTNMNTMFEGCDALISVPAFDTSKVTNMAYMFSNCSALTSVPAFDTSNVKNMDYMFNNCSALTSVPAFDTSKVTNMDYMFKNCTLLESVMGLDLNSVIYTNRVGGMFYYCKALTNLTLYNIRVSLTVGSAATYGHKLTSDSLIGLCKECIKGTSTNTLTVGSVNLNKIGYQYVKFTDPTVTTIADGEKGEVEFCDNSDEGAMTIEEYMTLKNWQLA